MVVSARNQAVAAPASCCACKGGMRRQMKQRAQPAASACGGIGERRGLRICLGAIAVGIYVDPVDGRVASLVVAEPRPAVHVRICGQHAEEDVNRRDKAANGTNAWLDMTGLALARLHSKGPLTLRPIEFRRAPGFVLQFRSPDPPNA
jgi:hypothetical protein